MLTRIEMNELRKYLFVFKQLLVGKNQMIANKTDEFESLAHQNMDALYTRALELQSEMTLVEDLVQQTLLKAFELFSSFRQDLDFQQWLFGLLDDVVQNQECHRHAA